jgi:hypothetical protein
MNQVSRVVTTATRHRTPTGQAPAPHNVGTEPNAVSAGSDPLTALNLSVLQVPGSGLIVLQSPWFAGYALQSVLGHAPRMRTRRPVALGAAAPACAASRSRRCPTARRYGDGGTVCPAI